MLPLPSRTLEDQSRTPAERNWKNQEEEDNRRGNMVYSLPFLSLPECGNEIFFMAAVSSGKETQFHNGSGQISELAVYISKLHD